MISKVANKPPCRDRRLIAMPPCHCLRRLCLALLDQSLVLLKKLYSHALAPAIETSRRSSDLREFSIVLRWRFELTNASTPSSTFGVRNASGISQGNLPDEPCSSRAVPGSPEVSRIPPPQPIKFIDHTIYEFYWLVFTMKPGPVTWLG